MFAEGCEEQRAIILYPVVSPSIDVLPDSFFAVLQWICRLEMFVLEPLLVVSPLRRSACARLLRWHT